MSEQPKTRHHFVPAFYLRGFVGNEGLLHVYDKTSEKEFPNTPDNLGFSNHYHTFKVADEAEDTNSIENYLSDEWEGPAARIIAAISSGTFPVGEDRALLAGFLGLTFTRTPNHRANVDAVLVDSVKRIADLTAATPERFEANLERYERETGHRTDDPEQLRRDILSDDFRVVAAPEMYLRMFIDHGLQFGEVILNMRWRFFRQSGKGGFITSDNPIFLHDPTIDPQSFYNGTGFHNRNVELTFPVTRNIALVGSWNKGDIEGFYDPPAALVDAINFRTILAAQRFVYVAKASEFVRKAVREFAAHRPRISFSK